MAWYDEKDLPKYIDRLIGRETLTTIEECMRWHTRHVEQSSNNYDPYEHIYDWLEDGKDCLSNDHIEQFVWTETGEITGAGNV